MYKATAVMGMATFVAVIAGAVKAKFLAVLLGPLGMGIFAQGMTFFLSAETICELGISTGVMKYVSEAWNNRSADGVRRVMRAAFLLQSISFVAFFIIILIFAKAISQFVFASQEYASSLILISLAVPLSSFLITQEAALLGLGRADIHSKGRIIYNIIGACILVSFVYVMKLQGGFLYIPINALVCIFIVYVFLKFTMKSREKARDTIDDEADFKVYFTKLLSYGGVMLMASSLTHLTVLYVRSLLIKHEGAAANGLYQVAFALVGYYTPFFTNSVWGYLFPKLSAINDESVFNIEVNKMLRFILLFLTPSISILFLLKKAIVILIFSKEFLGSLEIFPLYLVGSFFFMLSYIFGTTFLAKRQLLAFFAITLCQNVLYISLFTWLVGRFGLLAISISYCVTNLIGCLACASYQIWRTGLKINAGNLRLFLLSIGFILLIFFMPSKTILCYDLLKWALLILWAIFVIGKREKALLLSFIRRR